MSPFNIFSKDLSKGIYSLSDQIKIIGSEGSENSYGCCCGCANAAVVSYGHLKEESGWNSSFITNKNLVGSQISYEYEREPLELPVNVTFQMEASYTPGCGGSNSYRQNGTINHCIQILEETSISMVTSGLMETEDPGFDFSKITISGIGTAQFISTKSRGKCASEDGKAVAYGHLTPGIYNFTMEFDTVDGRWHGNWTRYYGILIGGGAV